MLRESDDRTGQRACSPTSLLSPTAGPPHALPCSWPDTGPRASPSSHLHYVPHLPPPPPPPSRGAWLRCPHPDPPLAATPTRAHPEPTFNPTYPEPSPPPTPTPTSLRSKIAALKKAKLAKEKQEKLDDAKGLPKWNIFRALPKQTQKGTRSIDGSYRFPKPWGKDWGSQGLTDG